jgi:hypothetical protein
MMTYLFITLVPDGWDQTYLPWRGVGVDAASRFKMGFRPDWYYFSSLNQPALYQPTKYDLLEYSFVANYSNSPDPAAPNFNPLSTNYGHISHGDEFRFYNTRMYSTTGNVNYNTNMSLTPEGMRIVGNDAARADVKHNYAFQKRMDSAGVALNDGSWGWDACTIYARYESATNASFSFVLGGWQHNGTVSDANSKNYPGIATHGFYIQVHNDNLQVIFNGPTTGDETSNNTIAGTTVPIPTYLDTVTYTLEIKATWNRNDGPDGTMKIYVAKNSAALTQVYSGAGSHATSKTVGMHSIDTVRLNSRWNTEGVADVTVKELKFYPTVI